MTDEGPERRDETEEEELRRLSRILGADGDEEFEAKVNDPEALAKLEEELEAVDSKLAAEASQRKAEMDEEQAAFDRRLQEIEGKAAKVKYQRDQEQKRIEKRRGTEQEDARHLGVGLSIAYVVIGLPLAGALAGYFVDNRIGSTVWKGFGMLIGAGLAVLMAFVIISRSNRDN